MSGRIATDEEDRRFTAAALNLGRRHNGLTWPNPSVGALVVRHEEGRSVIVAQGITARGGRPHAEPEALRGAGNLARGATLYVSLEPCSHHGRTPPCAEAIVAAGLGRVVTAGGDADPRVAGRGHAILARAGIRVVAGAAVEEAERTHRGHLTRTRHGRPAVTLKLARTVDGYAAAPAGEPRLLITGPNADGRTHLLRAHADAVMVGVATVLSDDPRLDVRLPGLADRSPVRIVLDSRLRLPPESRLARSAAARPTWLVCAEEADPEAERRLAGLGCDAIRCPRGPDGRLDLGAALALLASRGLTRVLCEGGPALAEALARDDLLDEVVLITGGAALGRHGLPATGPALAGALSGHLRLTRTERAGADTVQHFERDPCSPAS
ncbi:bifunctional diaminohydroxyphosphoribosylaminopyrimidine deaminase/5-amino-6-(5-phosphoribosylamino)uracil reductase RibD [Enterovirga sp.]|jgi:diaminohydroxyphosphoribosylaminopyrimidine deaminase/5-amino-6-(5-phosphoribosylamino)uracil reductase|uniref:bifunctional diaminohydroxyphosphoribosylaminopyrimidine deaminase/5-amino-6-(5-phosphoribosylamino)uracil reductase RibD n=1 Tax=Enterovirga sp. TaxID=2026350 RepID=UPI00262442C8|nr:bifunctional diaminohydroxyphosphoribosylaminopyrimidine deaminase/5-amino-6-(5-phosphoribosylamino)uracil reductase RibD [Enterovirga sp.]MDB5592401.1 riboflavin biosynthesis protein RibD [Enterovirga sp.]